MTLQVPTTTDEAAPTAKAPVSRSMTNLLRMLEEMTLSGSIGVTDIARRLRVPVASAHRLLKVLEASGFVEQVESTRQYRLTLKLFELGCNSARHTTIRDVAAVDMERLARDLGVAVNLGVLVGGDVLYLEKVQTDEFLTLNLHPGARVPAHCTALGKAILAFSRLDPRSILGEEPFAVRTETSVRTYDELAQELAETRRRGFAIDRQELAPGIWCVAAPVVNATGAVIASISTAAVKPDCDEATLEAWGNQTILAAHRIAGRATAFGDQIRTW